MRALISTKTIIVLACIAFGYWFMGSGCEVTQASCCQYDIMDSYTASIVRGERLVQELISPLSVQSIDQKRYCCARAHLRAIIDVIHYFDALAQAKNQAFCEGTFIVEDCAGTIYNFLKSYTHTYRRISSHFNEYGVQHYGLDIPLSKRACVLFPRRKRHILFAQLDHRTLFIKPENYGTNIAIPTDMIMHCKEYVQYLMRGCMRLGFERGDWREERVPEAVVHAWRHFLRHWIDDAQRIVQLVRASKIHGIKSIIEHLPAICQQVAQPTMVQKAAHTQLLYILEQYDHCHMRRGSEVILRGTDFIIA